METIQTANPSASPNPSSPSPTTNPHRGWWWRTLVRGVLLLFLGIFLIFALGQAQRWGWITDDEQESADTSEAVTGVIYTCPMDPQIRQPIPGDCPICGMPLEPVQSAAGNRDTLAVLIEPAARRLAGIRTAEVRRAPVSRTLRTPGMLTYDESRLATLISYTKGRIEEQYANVTGEKIEKGAKLFKVFSPRLEEAQVALLEAKRTLREMAGASVPSILETQRGLVEQTRRQLRELGMSSEQIAKLETTGRIESRMLVHATKGGTILERMVSEGQEIDEGQVLYKLADLSVVWLMLELFPDDVTQVDVGQEVKVEVRSFPGRTFLGKVAFVEPFVDAKTRSVRVRVAMANPTGELRPGDYATAKITIPLNDADSYPLVIPRSAVLRVGDKSVVYVETHPGRFEIRPVKVKTVTQDEAIITEPVSRAFFEFYPAMQALEVVGAMPFNVVGQGAIFPHAMTQHWDVFFGGIRAGEQVAVSGNFLIDSQMQLAGNPSLIDTSKLRLDVEKLKIQEALAKLSPADRKKAEAQVICPVTEEPLGWMGPPMKITVEGEEVFICCKACIKRLRDNPQKYLKRLDADLGGKP